MKNSKFSTRLTNDRGQAAIEYVLLLIISVSMVLALVYQIFKPMEKYMQAFMGDYVQCLLETGALPSFGGDGVPNAQDMGCSLEKFQDVAGKTSSGGKGGGSRSGSDSDDGGGSSSSKSSSGSDSSSGGSSRNSTYAGSSSRGGGRYFRAPRKVASGVESSGPSGKVIEIALEGGGSGGFFKGRSGGGYAIANRRKISSVNMAGMTEAERKKLEKKSDTGRTVVIATDDFSSAPKKIAVKKPEPKAEVIEDEQPLTVGNFIRYLFIAALIIALVIFIGGQALSMSKGSEN